MNLLIKFIFRIKIIWEISLKSLYLKRKEKDNIVFGGCFLSKFQNLSPNQFEAFTHNRVNRLRSLNENWLFYQNYENEVHLFESNDVIRIIRIKVCEENLIIKIKKNDIIGNLRKTIGIWIDISCFQICLENEKKKIEDQENFFFK
jgi:hypothetical protein